MTPTPAKVHVPARSVERVDQVKRYMRRHCGVAMFCNLDTDVSLNLDDVPALTRREILDHFNAARRKGLNQ